MSLATGVWREVKCDLSQEIRDELVALALASPEKEVCGFILDNDLICEITNVHENPKVGFEMNKEQMLDVLSSRSAAIKYTYHSHPSCTSFPSAEDSEKMTYLYQQGCPWRYLIVTKDGVFEYEHQDKSA